MTIMATGEADAASNAPVCGVLWVRFAKFFFFGIVPNKMRDYIFLNRIQGSA